MDDRNYESNSFKIYKESNSSSFLNLTLFDIMKVIKGLVIQGLFTEESY